MQASLTPGNLVAGRSEPEIVTMLMRSFQLFFATVVMLMPGGVSWQRSAAPPVAAPAIVDSGAAAEALVIPSRILGRDRHVSVSLPPSHGRTERPYPVILILDGEYNFAPAVTVATKLAQLGHIPEAIVVGVANASADYRDRVHDMTPPGLSVSGSSLNEGGDRFLDFLEEELLPEIARRYRGGTPAMLVGHSSGGIIATYAAATRAAFSVVVSIDAPIHLGEGWLAERLMERARAAPPGPLRYISMESRFGWTADLWAALEEAAPREWRLERRTVEGESHETMPFIATYGGLKHAFADYSVVGAPLPPYGPASAAFRHYSDLAASLGAELPPPAPVLRRLIEDLLIEGRVEPSLRALDWLTAGYGETAAKAELEAMIERVAALPPLEETLESLLATPFPTPDEIAPYLGEWRGHMWMNPVAKSAIGLRIRVVDGKVAGEALDWFVDGTVGTRPLDYLRVTDDGLEYGVMNGMRPMGLLVYSGTKQGDVLEGMQAFRGIVLPLPDGHMPPDVHFRLARQ